MQLQILTSFDMLYQTFSDSYLQLFIFFCFFVFFFLRKGAHCLLAHPSINDVIQLRSEILPLQFIWSDLFSYHVTNLKVPRKHLGIIAFLQLISEVNDQISDFCLLETRYRYHYYVRKAI